ncbi:triose-phosphate isomerase [Treponema parvum]|uniref:Triosephosphate isomerase n=1 Tax=Treponema parvum TaxID=138851 RepID=A0A975EYW1_9SPIR|nr:triose-phosphate isomerase [Treponema parvum]QTQ11348.1 triose-phosphate isomerase [Treponema parvum]
MRKHYIAGNWKMNLNKAQSLELAKALVKELKGKPNKYMIAAPFVYLDALAPVLKGSNILLGAQNMAATDNGAHTGEVSADMLKDIGVQSVILGHSERRHEMGESDSLINAKVKKALEKGLEVVLCIGELLEEREAGNAEKVCAAQLTEGLKGVSEDQLKNVTIAYEPVWAIGTGKTATPDDAQAIHKFCRKHIEKMYGKAASDAVVIQYGGSMKASNAKELLAMEDIDGGLIGGASLAADTFVPICVL